MKVIVGGDFIVSSLPNAGTPFRVQRYVLEWAEALEAMAAVEPAAIVSGHGDVFTDDATDMLLTTSRALRWLDTEVVRRINAGQWQEQILARGRAPRRPRHEPVPPAALRLHVVRGARSCCAATWAGTTATRRWCSRRRVPRSREEVVALSGGTAAILARADELAAGDAADQQRALHLVDFVIDAGGDDVAAAPAGARPTSSTLGPRASDRSSPATS